MSPLRWLVPLCLVSVLWAFSFGVNAPLASLWMQEAGCSDHLIGLNTGTYYLGIALASAGVPWAMRRFGCAALFVGVFASAVTAAAFPWGGGVAGWFFFRALNGAVAALSLIPLETFVNRVSRPDRRATNFGCYAFCIALGMALGNLVALQMAPTQPRLAFLLAGASALVGSIVVMVWRPRFPTDSEEVASREPIRFGRNFLAFGSGWAQGFLEGGMVALLPIYLLSVGLSNNAVSWLMSGLMIGVILAQAPLAWLADRFGRAAVLAGCNAVALAGVACLMWTGNTVWLAFWLFAVGACSGAVPARSRLPRRAHSSGRDEPRRCLVPGRQLHRQRDWPCRCRGGHAMVRSWRPLPGGRSSPGSRFHRLGGLGNRCSRPCGRTRGRYNDRTVAHSGGCLMIPCRAERVRKR